MRVQYSLNFGHLLRPKSSERGHDGCKIERVELSNLRAAVRAIAFYDIYVLIYAFLNPGYPFWV